jgi:carbon-monoxide dehydrogenase small subunit
MSKTVALAFVLNGRRRDLEAPANRILADFLREEAGLLGCKVGCDQAVCGACTVLIDGVPSTACTTFLFEVDEKAVTTIEGLTPADGSLHPIQQAFVAAGGFQCGFCTPGMVLSAKALLDRVPAPGEATIRDWLASNICRCTGYAMIIDAIKLAARTYPARGVR